MAGIFRKLGLTLAVVAASSLATTAAEIRQGATVTVKANSIWFQAAEQIDEWQRLKKTADAAGLAAYQEKVLGEREAWQFDNRLEVKILKHEPEKGRVQVEMKMPGRMQGTPWLLDVEAIE